MVAQKDPPLAVGGDRWGLVQDLGDGVTLFLAQGHEHARHEGKVKAHMALVAVPEICPHIPGPLVGLRQQDAVGEVTVHVRP